MQIVYQILLCLCALFWSWPTGAGGAAVKSLRDPTVEVNNGTIQGIYNAEHRQDLFLGIPYAQPPVDTLRFAQPRPLDKKWGQPLLAHQYSPFCHGKGLELLGFDQDNITYPESEDCLTLNIVKPSGVHPGADLPVLVWIYGGGFQEGGSGDARYNMSFLVQTSTDMGNPIIGVSLNYRLGPFGFIAGKPFRERGMVNLGLHDQRLALRWVQENIRAFGGDPQRVTIQGESAGAASVGFHLLANGGRDERLFHAAIAESGGPFFYGRFDSASTQDSALKILVDNAGCANTTDIVLCLQSVSTNSILQGTSSQWNPIIDDVLFHELSSEALDKGAFVRVPLLIGANTDEGTTLMRITSNITVDSSAGLLEALLGFNEDEPLPSKTKQEFLKIYGDMNPKALNQDLGTVINNPGPPYGSFYGRVALMIGDLMMIAGRRISAQAWAKYGVDCYSYRFDAVPAYLSPKTIGAAHFQEVPYVFNSIQGIGYESNPFGFPTVEQTEQNIALAKLMSQMWVSFVTHRSPNFHKVSELGFGWPKYSLENPENIVFNASSVRLEPDNVRENAIDLIHRTAVEFGR